MNIGRQNPMAEPSTQTPPLRNRQTEPFTVVVRKAKLKVLSGPDDDKEVIIDGPETSIGTARSNTFVLSDATISRHHAVIQESAGGYLIRDLESTNGTELNNLPVREAYLEFGTTLTLGETLLKFVPFEETLEIFPSADSRWGSIYGQSVQMRSLFAVLDKVAGTGAAIILQGETGTEKARLAESIHHKSRRKDQPFALLDCSAATDNPMESELFGHKKGAFTGAAGDRKGVFENGNNGTVFLDEISELAPGLQLKLLHVLENREVQPVGENRTVPINVRLITAADKSLPQAVKQGRFCKDLFYRLSAVKLDIPPLRDRREDLPLIAGQMVKELCREHNLEKPPQISRKTFEILQSHNWPGNMRELRNVLSRAMVTGTRTSIAPGDLLLGVSAETAATTAAASENLSFRKIEKAAIQKTLEHHRGNKTKAAGTLDITAAALSKKLKKHNIR